jgi:hypothetical protein
VATAEAPAANAPPAITPAAPNAAPAVKTVAAAKATIPTPIKTPEKILPHRPELFFSNRKVYLLIKPSDI